MADVSEFQQLCNRRDLAAYSLVGAAQVASAYLNLGEIEKAQNLLQGAVLDYELADSRIAEFHQNAVLATSKKENQSDGNRSAAA